MWWRLLTAPELMVKAVTEVAASCFFLCIHMQLLLRTCMLFYSTLQQQFALPALPKQLLQPLLLLRQPVRLVLLLLHLAGLAGVQGLLSRPLPPCH
jgi:hypothetical protein